MSKQFLFCILAVVSLFLTACSEKEQEITVQSIAISQPSAELKIGETLNLKATVSPSNATYDGITWTSTKTSVATVSTSGQVSALAEGNTTITAMAGGKTASCSVTVVKGVVAVSSISLNKDSIELVEGDSETLTATVSPNDATDKTVSWSSSNTGVATVQDGTITAIKEGEASITAKAGEKTASCKVVVAKKVIPVESIGLNKTELALVEGDSETLTATISPEDATDKTISWTSSRESIATVKDGIVTAISEGEATITAKAGEKTASCKVVVNKKPTYFLNCEYGNIKQKMNNLIINVIPKNLVSIYIDGIKQDTISNSYYFDEGTTHSISFEFSKEILEIAEKMFYRCEALTFIELPQSVLTIGSQAFYECRALRTVEFPAGLQSIDYDAFRYCSSIKEIIIPDSTVSIGRGAFQYVYPDKVYLGKSVTTLGNVGYTQNASSIVVSSENKHFDSRDNCNAIIETSSNTMLYGCPISFVPNGIEIINTGCFSWCKIKELAIPDSVHEIKADAFYRCENIVLDFGNTRTIIPTIDPAGNAYARYYVVPDNLYDFWLDAYKNKLWPSEIIKYSDYHQ